MAVVRRHTPASCRILIAAVAAMCFYIPGPEPALASERLAEFSNIVQEIDAPADAPSVKQQSPAATPQKSGSTTKAPAALPANSASTTKAPAVLPANSASTTKAPAATPANSAGTTKAPAATPAKTGTSTKKSTAAPVPAPSQGRTVAIPKSSETDRKGSTGKTTETQKKDRIVPLPQKKPLIDINNLIIVAGAERHMSDSRGSTASAASDGSAKTSSGKAGSKDAPAEDPDRLAGFVSIVKDAEKKAGITDSDPESEAFMGEAGDGENDDADRLAEFSKLAGTGGNDMPEGEGDDSRLEEFAELANEQDGDGGDARLKEFAELSGGVSDTVDDRVIALAKEAEEREEEMARKYGPRIEDHVISDPVDYGDGDRVVATENSKKKSAERYGSDLESRPDTEWKKGTDEKERKAEEIIRSIYGSLNENDAENTVSGNETDRKRSLSREDRIDMSGFFSGIKESVEDFENSDKERLSLGTFQLTAYDACIICCGKTDGITATGTKAKAGRTIAVDPDIIPYGSKVMIGGHVYIAEDCGSAIKGKKIDVFLPTHDEALRFGRKQAEVFLVK